MFEIKKGVLKRGKQALREPGFSKQHKKWMEWNISLGELRPFSAFVMLKETFGKH